MSRLTLLHINIIGVVVALLVGAGLYFTIITGAMETKKKAEADHSEVEGRASKLASATRALEQANADKAQAEADWAVYEKQYMPVIGYSRDRLTTWLRTFVPNRGKSWPERFIRTIRTHMARERKANQIDWDNPGALVLPSYGPDPNTIDVGQPGESFGPVVHYSYQMAVRARSIDKLMRHIRSWTSLSQAGVPVVEGLQVTGNSPNLNATYNVTFTIIVRDEIPAPVPRISASGGGGAMGGPGGMRGGPMGGPMGMSGPPGMMGGPPGMAGGPGAAPMGMGAGPRGMGSAGGMGAPGPRNSGGAGGATAEAMD